MSQSLRTIFANGLRDNNVIFVQSLALCPTMAVTGTATNGLGMGLATTVVLILSNFAISLLRNIISEAVRIPVFIIIIATLVTLVDMALNAWLHELYKVLGLFIALIVVNCAILGRAESFASREGPFASLIDGVASGLGFTLALVVIGGAREIIGSGTLFAGASLLLGPAFSFMELTLIEGYRGALLMILPPGGFLVLGLLMGVWRRLEARRTAAAAAIEPAAA
ncbi:MAG TPA: electron transport complex subunit E [Gammaproteobacteria bacterium]